jgi:hypothetical protein
LVLLIALPFCRNVLLYTMLTSITLTRDRDQNFGDGLLMEGTQYSLIMIANLLVLFPSSQLPIFGKLKQRLNTSFFLFGLLCTTRYSQLRIWLRRTETSIHCAHYVFAGLRLLNIF